MAADREKIRLAAGKLAKSEKCDVLLFNGPCYSPLDALALPKLRTRQKVAGRPARAVWVITTPGGIPEIAYRLSRTIQATYDHTTALIGGWCKSAGTLCVIAADNIAMSEEAELGPLDVQLARRDEIDERDSGLVIDEALDCLEQHAFAFFDAFMRQIKDGTHGLVTLKMASEISANVTKGLFEPIYRQIDPQKIGEIARSMAVGRAYAQRLNMRPRNLKLNALENLLMGYPSHGFVIDRAEAQHLFKSVSSPTEPQAALLNDLGRFALVPDASPSFELFTPEESYEDPTAQTPSNSAKARAKAKATNSQDSATAGVRRRASVDGRVAATRKAASTAKS